MNYPKAYDYYKNFMKILTPVSERIEVVGSVKRADPKAQTEGVHDLEFLIIPNADRIVPVFGAGLDQPKNKLERLLMDLKADEVIRTPVRKADGEKFKKFAIVEASGSIEECNEKPELEFCLELYLVTARTWAIQNVIRTGPSVFSHRFVTPESQVAFHHATGKKYKGLLPAYYEYISGETVIRVRHTKQVLDLKEERDAIKLLGLRPESDYWIPPDERYMYT